MKHNECLWCGASQDEPHDPYIPHGAMKHKPTGTAEDIIRTVKLSPYRKGMGPTFTLRIGDPVYSGNRDKLTYTLTMHDSGKSSVVFEGSDFGPSPLHAWDSDATVSALLGFLTLRPGDTDAEYFQNYTEDQTRFAQEHAEALSCYAADRFERD